MARRRGKVLGTALCGVALAAALVWWRSSPAEPPSIVLVSIDTLRPDHLGCYGYSRNTSPALDRLAREGARFKTAVSSTSWTLPAHAALFTGLPDRVHGCGNEQRWLDRSRFTLAEALQQAGYHTAGFYSGPLLHRYFGLSQGFDSWTECTSYREQIDRMIREWRYDPRIEEQAFRDVTNPIVLAAVRAWIESAPRRPFFLFIHLWDVHHDYIPPPPYDALFREGTTARPGDGSREDLISRYDGEIRWTDATLAAIFEALDRRGLKDRSILLVTADHGEAFFEHGHHGHRFTLHDEEVRVPLLVRYPGRLPAGLCIEPPVSLIDIAPTLLDLAGLPPLPAALGRSLVPLLEAAGTSATWKERPAISEFRDHRQMLALRLERWKLIADLTSGTVQVYDLERDPGEHSPLGAADPSVPAAALAAHWERTVRQLDAAAARLPVPQTRDWTGLPEVHRRHLRSLGYLR